MAPFYELDRPPCWKIFGNKEKKLLPGDVVEITRKVIKKEGEGRKKVASVLVKNDNEIELRVINTKGLLVERKRDPDADVWDSLEMPSIRDISPFCPIGERFRGSKIRLKREGIIINKRYDPNVVEIRWSDSEKE